MDRTRVLVVEDQPLAAKDVDATLSVMDYEVPEIVRKGEEAIERAAELDPDVVLMDIELAGEMDGIEAAQRIQDEHDVPIVFLTAHTEPDTVGRAKQFGPYGYISKPVDAIELRTAIEVATRKRELDEQLERTRLEMASFAQTVAEQLQGPLEGTTQRLEDLEHVDGSGLSQRGRQALAEARERLAGAREMMDGLVAYAEAGEVEVSEPTDAEAALASVLGDLEDEVEERGVEVTHDALPEVMLPRKQTEQLLGNLVENAVEHADVGEPRVHVSAREETDETVLIVQDNGQGIAPEAHEHVFDLFHRGRSAGVGVGLAVCKRIAETSGGGIWVDSEPGEGARFFVRLPTPPRERADQASASPER